MTDKGHKVNRSRNAIRLAIVVLTCLLLTYCAHRLYSAWNSGSPPSMTENQDNSASGAPDKKEQPLLSAKQETGPLTGTSQDLPRALEKELHRQEERLAATKPVQAKPFTTQDIDAEQRREASASSKEVISKTKNGFDNDRPVPAPSAKQAPVADVVAQTPDVHQNNLADNVADFGETFTEPISGMDFILVRGGCYQMGSNLTAFEGPVHEVCIDDFYLAKYEVTQRQWSKIMGRHFSYFKGSLRPVERVTWDDSQRFIRQLKQRSGAAYRLPTEAEWEYAARSRGEDKLYAGASDDESLPRFAWHVVNSNRQTHMVGMKKPNSLGLHDMSGNVWEWCSDWYDDSYYANSTRNNPQGPDTGKYRVIRGGEWELPAGLTRTTYREAAKPHVRRNDIGFRLALSLPN